MKFWLLEKGEKTGPHESFVIRERIDSGELDAEMLAWFEGADGWVPLGEVAQFETLFKEEDSELVSPPPVSEMLASKSQSAPQSVDSDDIPPLYVMRRFFARMHDSALYITIVFLVFRQKAVAIFSGESAYPLLGVGLAYVVIDGLMTHVFKCSPGKFLLGMRVTNALGHAIPLKFALLRSLRVWILGLGMWMMTLFSLPISWFFARKLGYFLWDMPKKYRVVAHPISGKYVLSYVVSLMLMSAAFNTLPKQVIHELNERSGAYKWMDKWSIPYQK